MSNWTRDVEARDFLKWAYENPEEFEEFWEATNLLAYVEDLEQDDFFGTEGFDKRFG